MLINAEHLTLALGGSAILKDVAIHLDRGQIYGLLGPNGAGKSTTIAVILGLYQADSGRLELFDAPTKTHSAEVRRRIGVMPEHAGFYDWMTAADYLVWYAGLYGGLQHPVPKLLARVALEGAGDKPIGQFSRGMRQRLALARALLHGPALLVLDEPTNGLDPRGRREIHDLLLELARACDVGILLCTHLLDDVTRLCDRIGIINQGRTVLEGPLAGLLGNGNEGHRFRLRLQTAPDTGSLPEGVRLLGQDGGWWHLHLPPGADPSVIWRNLLARGWRITEVRSEGGGLEELYLRLTSETGAARQGEAA